MSIFIHCLKCNRTFHLKNKFSIFVGGKSARGIRVSSYDPDDPNNQNQTGNSGTDTAGGYVASKTLGNQRKFMPGSQRVATISQNYNEKTMLLSSDDEYQ